MDAIPSPFPEPLITWRDLRLDDVTDVPRIAFLDMTTGAELGAFRLTSDAVTALVDALVGVAEVPKGEVRVLVKVRAEDLARGLPPFGDIPGSRLLLSQRAALDRAGVPSTGPNGEPVSDGWRVVWLAERWIEMQRWLNRSTRLTNTRAEAMEVPGPTGPLQLGSGKRLLVASDDPAVIEPWSRALWAADEADTLPLRHEAVERAEVPCEADQTAAEWLDRLGALDLRRPLPPCTCTDPARDAHDKGCPVRIAFPRVDLGDLPPEPSPDVALPLNFPPLLEMATRAAKERHAAFCRTAHEMGRGPTLVWSLLDEATRQLDIATHVRLLADLSKPGPRDAWARWLSEVQDWPWVAIDAMSDDPVRLRAAVLAAGGAG